VAANDSASTDDKTAISIAVLANDKDDDGHRLTINTASAVHGSVVISADQKLLYTPKRGFDGVDTIRYTIRDGAGGEASAEVSVTIKAYQDVVVNNKSSGGSMSLWLLFGLASLVLVRRKQRLTATSMVLLGLSPVTQASDWSERWYAQWGFGSSKADVSSTQLRAEIPHGVFKAFDSTGRTQNLTLGYELRPHLAFEIGYLDLGNAGVAIQSDSLNPEQYHELVKAVTPVLVDGFTLGISWQLLQTDSFEFSIPYGVMRWDSSIRSQMGDSVKETKDEGTTLFYGAQAHYQFARDWQLGIGLQQLELKPNTVRHWQFLVRYRF
jgi:hypothetical protein